MTTEVKVASRGTPLSEIAALMRSEGVGMLPVVDGDGRLLGLVTDRDLVVRGFASGRPVDALKAEDVMSDELVAVAPEDPIRGVLEMMGRRQVRRVPVVDEADRLVGIVSIADIASRADYDHELQDAFERISARRSFWSRLWL
jgi:CBS domain-containing protein